MSVRFFAGRTWRPFQIVNPGATLTMIAGPLIAVETWAVEWGQHEFDYEVNSRPLARDGQPQAIMTTRQALRDEFFERRVVPRQPIPFSMAFPNGMMSRPEIALTYGEVAPQTYQSRISASQVGWQIAFKEHRLNAVVGKMGSVKNAAKRNNNASAIANGANQMENMPSSFDYLMVYIPTLRSGEARVLPGGFGAIDVIGDDPSLVQQWMSRLFGR